MKRHLTLFCSVLLAAGCINPDYDLSGDNLDMTIAVGGDQITLPLLTTRPLGIASLIGDGLEADPDSHIYHVEVSAGCDISGQIPAFSPIGVPAISASSSINSRVPGVDVNVPGLPASISIPDGQTETFVTPLPVKAEFSTDVDIKSLDEVKLEGALINLDAALAVFPEMTAGKLYLDLSISFPDKFVFDDSRVKDNVLEYKDVEISREKGFSITPALEVKAIRGLDFSGGFSIDETISVSGQIKWRGAAVKSASFSDAIRIDFTVGMDKSSIVEVTGTFGDTASDPAVFNFDIRGNVPEELAGGDAVINLCNPCLTFTLAANTGIPASAHVTAVPVIDGKEVPENGFSISLAAPVSDGKEVKTVKYFVGEASKAPEGCTRLDADLTRILCPVPDAVKIYAGCSIDENAKTTINLKNSTPSANVDVKMDIPLEFGPGSHVSSSEIIEIGSDIGDLLENNDLGMICDVASTIPLQLEMQITALDGNGDEVSAVPSTKGTVKAWDGGSTPTSSKFELKLENRRKGTNPDVSKLRITFTLSSGDKSGVAIRDDAYVQARIAMKVAGGIKLDLN